MAEKKSPVTHSLLIKGYMLWEWLLDKKIALPLTCYWLWDEMRLSSRKGSVTYFLFVGQGIRILGRNKGHYHSLAMDQEVRWDETAGKRGATVTHSLLVTDEMRLLNKAKGTITHMLLDVGWNEMKWDWWLQRRQCHSQTVCNVMRQLGRKSTLSLTPC